MTRITIKETAGLDRHSEPVSLGIPFPKGAVKASGLNTIGLADSSGSPLPCQALELARWPDGSLKWVLLNFQAAVPAHDTATWQVSTGTNPADASGIDIREHPDQIHVNTGAALFSVNPRRFVPFDEVMINGRNMVDPSLSQMVLTGENDLQYTPFIDTICFETKGRLQSTLKAAGAFKNDDHDRIASFFSRIHFFANSGVVKIDFTLLNPDPALHPGGLWDLGDPGSVFFKDLSLRMGFHTDNTPEILWKPHTAAPCETITGSRFRLYQDSSGGIRWNSPNHVNCSNQVRNRFQGYQVTVDQKSHTKGLRPEPVLMLQDDHNRIQAAVPYFWQEFPKALAVDRNTISAGLFPKDYDDQFELQGGEQKTHTVFFDFSSPGRSPDLDWVHAPLIPVLLPDTYTRAKVFPFFTHKKSTEFSEIWQTIDTAVTGENSFFQRRELTDEYGWRHFGDLYADHESVLDKTGEVFPTHYNNQYDCIFGSLQQFAATGNPDWFVMGHELCRHVKDIDIYHTHLDRPEYNHGLFWHTEHYIKAETASHRCFSRRHAPFRNLDAYGGGPSLSHTYATGMLYHYYLTGDPTSKETVLNLAEFVIKNLQMHHTLCNRLLGHVKSIKNRGRKKALVDDNKVYGLDGPGRASGNALSTLMDAFVLTWDKTFLHHGETIIHTCISPDDDIEKRDLPDIENRWMYTVFLQAVGKYLEIMRSQTEEHTPALEYARLSLLHYARWMTEHEVPYLSRPEKLEYPNETWAVQELRKADILFYAARYAPLEQRTDFYKKAELIFQEAVKTILSFETITLTRTLALLMQNSMMGMYYIANGPEEGPLPDFPAGKEKMKKNQCCVSLTREIRFIKWRLKRP